MSKYQRPGVFPKETDISQVIGVSGTSIGAVVGASPRGPINERTLVTNTKDFVTLFGEPDLSFGYMQHTALAFLEESNSLYVTRVVAADAKHSALKVNQDADITITNEVVGTSDADDVNFTGTLANLGQGIVESSLTVTVEGQGATSGTDDGLGAITGTGISSGTINYTTGAFNITLDTTPGDGNDVYITYDYTPSVSKAVSGGLSVADLAGDLFAADNEAALLIRAENPGVWGNSLKITLDNIDATEKTFDISVYEVVDGVDILREVFEGCSRVEGVDGYGVSQYVEDKINEKSIYISVVDNTDITDTVLPQAVASVIALTNGANGAAVSESDVSTGWDYYANPDEVNVSILLNAGYVTATTFAVQTKMNSIALARRDCFCILDAPSAKLDTSDLITWRNTTQNFNTSFCGLFAPWVEVNNSFNNKKIVVPPSGFIGQLLVRTDLQKDPWFAPAGLNRGIIRSGILSVIKLNKAYTTGNQDLLYAAGVNFILSKPGRGIALWGQKTQQTKRSALDRINVRRLIITIEKSVKEALEYVVFEQNDEFTRSQVEESIASFMDQIQARDGVSAYQVVCDETNNTPSIIDQNQMNVDIYVQPTRTAEFIQLQTIITRTGVSFSDLIATGGNF